MLLSDLNDDCLEQIFELLPLRDQFALKKMCRRFDDNIETKWKRRSKKVEIPITGEDEPFLEYIKAVSNVVEELNITSSGSKQFNLLKGVTFSKVTTLYLEPWYVVNDRDVLLIAQRFPSLEKLKIRSDITGQYLRLFEHLTHLDISGCENVKAKYLGQVFAKSRLRSFSWLMFAYDRMLGLDISKILQCKTLEELKVDENFLESITDEILRFPAMRKLTSFERFKKSFFPLAGDIIGDRMESLVCNTNSNWRYNLNSLQKMLNLRKLVVADETAGDTDLRPLTMLRNLREITFTAMRYICLTSLLRWVECCVQLELLDVSGTYDVDEEFLRRLIDVVEKQSGKRSVQLELHCHHTQLAKTFSEAFPLPEYLQVSVAERFVELPDSEYFVCEWQPIKYS